MRFRPSLNLPYLSRCRQHQHVKEAIVRSALLASCFLLSGLTTLEAQSRSTALIGTWKVRRFCDQDSAGAVTDPMGPNPTGYFIYTATGQLSIHAMRTPPTGPVAGDSVRLRTLAELRPYYFSYFGTFTIMSDSTVIHHVEGGTFPEYIGTDQHRAYRISGDTLHIGGQALACRVLVRVP